MNNLVKIWLALLGLLFIASIPFLLFFGLGLLGWGLAGFLLLLSFRLLFQYERGVIFTLGKYTEITGPGLIFLVPFIQEMRKVDMRIKTADIPRQEVITKDNIPLLTNSVVYFRVERPDDAIIKIEDYIFAISQLTQTALRDVIGNQELDFVLSERVKIAENIREIVDAETVEWGIDVKSIKIQEIELPAEMKRAMAAQAEAERQRRATIIMSEGELSASENLQKAAEKLSKNAAAVHLRTLQTIRDIAQDPSEKIVIFIPSDFEKMAKQFLGQK